MKRHKGFTLVELLVVIAIIALLMSILIPVLGRARAQAKLLYCANNLRQLTFAWQMYSDDNNNKLCSPGTRYTMNPDSQSGLTDWVWAPTVVGKDFQVAWPFNPPYPFPEQREEGIKRGVLWPYVKNVKAYHCPGDRSEGGNYRSYSMPDCMGAVDSAWWYTGDKYVRWKSYLQIPKPAQKIVFLEENDWRGFNAGSFIIEPIEPEWVDPLTVWHRGASSFAFADGHADSKSWSFETVEYFMSRAHGGFEPTTDGGIEDVEWFQEGWSPAVESYVSE